MTGPAARAVFEAPETSPDKLPQWHGRPVPWVTRWTNQVLGTRSFLDRGPGGRPFVTYRSPQEFRDRRGALWLHEGAGRSGKPQWKMVSTYRQRMCMTRRICQVCGSKIPTEATPWLVDGLEWDAIAEARALNRPIHTVTTPVCPGCIPLALRLCPQLSLYRPRLLSVAQYKVWGVHGETYHRGRKILAAVGYDDPRLRLTVARQQMVELTAWHEIPLEESKESDVEDLHRHLEQ